MMNVLAAPMTVKCVWKRFQRLGGTFWHSKQCSKQINASVTAIYALLPSSVTVMSFHKLVCVEGISIGSSTRFSLYTRLVEQALKSKIFVEFNLMVQFKFTKQEINFISLNMVYMLMWKYWYFQKSYVQSIFTFIRLKISINETYKQYWSIVFYIINFWRRYWWIFIHVFQYGVLLHSDDAKIKDSSKT